MPKNYLETKFHEKFLKNLNYIKPLFYKYLNEINFFTKILENIKKLNKKINIV